MEAMYSLMEKAFDKMNHFRTHADAETFDKIFGKEPNQGPHLWQSFNVDHDVVKLWSSLNKEDRKKLLEWFKNQ